MRLDHLTLHDSARIDHVLRRRLGHIEQRGIKPQPAQHLVVPHRLRDVIDRRETTKIRDVTPVHWIELDVPHLGEFAPGIDEVQKTTSKPTYRRNLEIAGSDSLSERLIQKLLSAFHSGISILHLQSDRTDRRTVRDVEGMGKTLFLAVDNDVYIALAPAGYRLGLVHAGFRKAEALQDRFERGRGGFIDGEFDEFHAAADRSGRQGRQARDFLAGLPAQLVQQMDQRALPIDRDATRRAGAELIVEDLERQQPVETGRLQSLHEGEQWQVALTWHGAEVAAPG